MGFFYYLIITPRMSCKLSYFLNVQVEFILHLYLCIIYGNTDDFDDCSLLVEWRLVYYFLYIGSGLVNLNLNFLFIYIDFFMMHVSFK